jgi:hypothetical protein
MVTFILGTFVVPLCTAFLAARLVLRGMPRVLAAFNDGGGHPIMADKTAAAATPEKVKEPVTRLFVVLIVSMMLVLSLGVQQWVYQHARDEAQLDRDKHDLQEQTCLQLWADEMRESITLARSFTKELEAALERRNEAVDAIILIVVDFQAVPEGDDPPPQLVEKFNAALAEFVAARTNLVEVKATVDRKRLENPFPKLDLTCDAGAEAVRERYS